MRRALEELLRHRGSEALGARAHVKLRELEAAVGGEKPEPERVQRLYGEITFGFRAALEVRPENADAQAGLAQATGPSSPGSPRRTSSCWALPEGSRRTRPRRSRARRSCR